MPKYGGVCTCTVVHGYGEIAVGLQSVVKYSVLVVNRYSIVGIDGFEMVENTEVVAFRSADQWVEVDGGSDCFSIRSIDVPICRM